MSPAWISFCSICIINAETNHFISNPEILTLFTVYQVFNIISNKSSVTYYIPKFLFSLECIKNKKRSIIIIYLIDFLFEAPGDGEGLIQL